MNGIAKHWLARLRNDSSSGGSLKPPNDKGNQPQGNSSMKKGWPQPGQAQPPKGDDILQAALTAQSSAEEIASVTQLKAKQLDAALRDVQQQLSEARDQAALLQQLCDEAKESVANAAAAHKHLAADQRSITAELSEANSIKVSQEEYLKQVKAEYQKLQGQLDDIKQQCGQLEQQLPESQRSNVDSKALEQMSKQLEAAQAVQIGHRKKIQRLTADAAALNKALETTVARRQEVEALQKQATAAVDDMTTTQQQLTANIEKLKQELSDAKSTQSAKESRLQKLNEKLVEKEKQLKRAEARCAALQEKLPKGNGTFRHPASKSLLQISKQLDVLLAERDEKAVEVSKTVADIEPAQIDLANAEAEVSKLQQLLEETAACAQSAVESQAQLTAELAVLSAELQQANSNHDEQQAKHEQVTGEFAKIQEQLAAAQQTVKELDMQYTQLSELHAARELQLAHKTKLKNLYAALNQAEAGLREADQRVLVLERLSLQATGAAEAACEAHKEALTDKAQLEQQLQDMQAATAAGYEKLCSVKSEARLMQKQLREACKKLDTLTVRVRQDLDKQQQQQQPLSADGSNLVLQQCCTGLEAAKRQLEGAQLVIKGLRKKVQRAVVEHQQHSSAAKSRTVSHSSSASSSKSVPSSSTDGSSSSSSACGRASSSCSSPCSSNSTADETAFQSAGQNFTQQQPQQPATAPTARIQGGSSSSSSKNPLHSCSKDHSGDQLLLLTENAELYRQLEHAQQVQANQKAAMQAFMDELSATRQDLAAAEAEIQELCDQAEAEALTPDVQQLTEELDAARAAQAAQQVKLLELTAELKRMQQQLAGAQERSSQLEQLCEEASDAVFSNGGTQPLPMTTQLLLNDLDHLKTSEASQACRVQQLTGRLAATQQRLVQAEAKCLELEDQCKQAQKAAADAVAAEQQIAAQMAEHKQELHQAKSSMAAQRVKLQRLQADLDSTQAAQQSSEVAASNEIAYLQKLLTKRDPDAAYKTAVRFMDHLTPALKLSISSTLQSYDPYSRADMPQQLNLDPKTSQALLKCITYSPAVRSILVLKQILQLSGESYFGAYLLKGAAKLLAVDPSRYQARPSQTAAAAGSSGGSRREEQRPGSSSDSSGVDLERLLSAAVPYALEGESLHQQDRAQLAIVATVLLRQQNASSSGLHYTGGAADPMYWSEALEAVAETDSLVRKDIASMIQAGPDSADNIRFVSGKAWMNCLRGVYWLGSDYKLAKSLLGLHSVTVGSSTAISGSSGPFRTISGPGSAAGGPRPDSQAGSSGSSSGTVQKEGIEVLRELAENYLGHVAVQPDAVRTSAGGKGYARRAKSSAGAKLKRNNSLSQA